MIRRKPTRKATGLTEAQKELQRIEEEIRRKEAALKERLEKIPAEAKKRRAEERRLQRVDTSTAAVGEIHHRRGSRGSSAPPAHSRLRKDRNQGKVKFLVLCLIFILLLIILWRAMPA